MTISYSPLLFPLASWLFSLAGTALALSILTQYSVIDTPNERSSHKIPVPRGGGIAMIIVALIFLASAGMDLKIIAAATLLAIISFIDDLRNMPVTVRLGAQAIAVIIATSALHGRIVPAIPLPLEQALIVLSWLWFINLFNFMDGIDGITSMETIMIMIGICIIAFVHKSLPAALVLHACIIAAATLGFFWFNRHPAKLFMGDIGSVTLGFLVACLLFELALHGQLLPALILPAYYVSDATFTLFKRLITREKIWQAHSQHAYQQAVRSHMTHTQVVRKITLLNICLVILANFATPDMIGVIMLIIAYILAACMIRHFVRKTQVE
jgi:UDP-N-acetylmuramyl pentapeptide phosphotransferase/UDP-N-acetylglucosamine-1-phosphate transferase